MKQLDCHLPDPASRSSRKGFYLSLLLLGCSLSTVLAVETPLESIRQKLCKSIYPQFGAANFDILDYPQQPRYELRLPDLHDLDEVVTVRERCSGRIAVLVAIDPGARSSPWTESNGCVPGLEPFTRIREEFADAPVEFISIWMGTSGNQVDAVSGRAFVEKYRLPGLALLDQKIKGRVPRSSDNSAFLSFAGVRIPGHRNDGTDVCILNKDGLIVYRAQEEPGVDYHTTRHILRRLLEPDYDAAVRREFQPEKSRALPVVNREEDGLRYRDDFESYGDNHSFKLAPCWGFTYENQSRLDLRPSLSPDTGIGNSRAVYVDQLVYMAGLVTYGLQHRFPQPLTDGTICFSIRRHPSDTLTEREVSPVRDPRRSLCVRFGQPGSYVPAGFLFATGDWMKETFVSSFRAEEEGTVPYSKDQWHQVTVTCAPGHKAQLSVDGQEIAQLASEAVDWVGFRLDQNGKAFYVDDFAILYRGDSGKLAAQHEAALAARAQSVEPVEPFAEEEIKAISLERIPVLHGTEQAGLAPGAVPRADIVGWKTPYYTFDHPLPASPLVLEDIRHPGAYEDIVQKHRGKIIWITRTHKGDHNTERNNRRRTADRSVTVFNRHYRLMNEYRPKGVVVLGVTCHDGGHRSISANHEDRILTAFENATAHEAMAADFGIPFDQVIYGFKPEAYDGIYVERFTNQMRLWTETMRGRIADGSFAGYGAEAIIDREGHIVYRGSGPDGFMYWKARYCLDRLLDPAFDVACRQEFRNPNLAQYRSPLLPLREATDEGLYYRDDFESYEDAYDLGLHPRWGFGYERPPSPDVPQVFAGKGRGESKAILVNLLYWGDVFCGNKCGALSARHEFPAPLTDGHFRLFIRRGPDVKLFGKSPIFRVAITFYGADGKPFDTLTTTGESRGEKFVTAPTDDFLKNWNCYNVKKRAEDMIVETGATMEEDAWQEIKVACGPGRKAAILIDGKPAVVLDGSIVTAVDLRAEVPTSYYVDDAELFYRGDADVLQQTHAEAVKADLARRQEEWKQEAADGQAAVTKTER